MKNQIIVKGKNPMDADIRTNKLEEINLYDTETLTKIVDLLKTDKAKETFKSKAALLKTLI